MAAGEGAEISVTSRIDDLAEAEFDDLDESAGPAACYGRLRQREADGRWRVRYVLMRDEGRLRAVIPLYESRMGRWPDPAYDPAAWGLPAAAADECGPASALLVAGCADRRTGLHADPVAASPPLLRQILAVTAKVAAEQSRCLVFPFVFAAAKDALSAAAKDQIRWVPLAQEAQVRDVADPDRESKLGSRVRYVLRRDRRLIADASLAESQAKWPDVADWAAPVIAAHYGRMGEEIAPEFIRLRHDEWERCPAVGLTAFVVRNTVASGVLTALTWRDQLELYEVGLTGENSPERLAVYLDLLFHLPVAFARRSGATIIRQGFKAETAKSSRGADFRQLYGGALDLQQTRRLADETRS